MENNLIALTALFLNTLLANGDNGNRAVGAVAVFADGADAVYFRCYGIFPYRRYGRLYNLNFCWWFPPWSAGGAMAEPTAFRGGIYNI